MFRFAGHVCTCFEIYRTFVHLPIFTFKKKHSVSNSAEGRQRQDAKWLQKEETGHWSLPRHPPPRWE
jgi:hypothetical protein